MGRFLGGRWKKVSLPLQPKDKVGKDSTFSCPNALWGPWLFRCNFGPNSESGFELSDIILVDEAFDIKDDAEITHKMNVFYCQRSVNGEVVWFGSSGVACSVSDKHIYSWLAIVTAIPSESLPFMILKKYTMMLLYVVFGRTVNIPLAK
jgi:hypothetical protein